MWCLFAGYRVYDIETISYNRPSIAYRYQVVAGPCVYKIQDYPCPPPYKGKLNIEGIPSGGCMGCLG